MKESIILRRLAIGFDDSKTVKNRLELVNGTEPLERLASKENIDTSRKILVWLAENPDCGIWWFDDPSYPDFNPFEKRLPFMLFYRGIKPTANQKRVAIVGTRHCDYQGLQKAFSLGFEAAANGICVVSGLAQGCDQAAAEGAVSAFEVCSESAPGYAILGCGLDVDYPKLSSKLKKRIVETGGALISRFAPDVLPQKYHFPNRNVIVSAMSESCIAVQAPEKSGTLITCDLSLQMGKDVFVSSEGMGPEVCRRGSAFLASEGAPVIESITDIVPSSRKALCQQSRGPFSVRFGSMFYSLESINKDEKSF